MTAGRKLKVAVVGCGQIADAHLQEIPKTKLAEVVAVCDRHQDLAYQAATRFGINGIHCDLVEMLSAARPDVVHITTPPQTHAGLAKKAIEFGCHVYVEKPFVLDLAEAAAVVNAAEERRLKICPGHDQLFDPLWQ